ncbi:MAG: ATP-binding protein [Waterburya sp.]
MNAQSIFIVEDEIITARSIAQNLKNFGYQVVGIATSGTKALEQIITTRPDLVLMDIFLQKDDIDGITTAERIKSQLNVPIIYLTAHSDQETLERAKATTPFGYVLKPYNKKNLQIEIEIALHKHQQEMELIKREKLLSTILTAAHDAVVATNKTSEITYMNPAAQKLTGWDLTEAYNCKATEIIQIIDQRTQQPIHPIEQVLTGGQVVYLDEYAVLIKKNGEQTSIKDSVSPILKTRDQIEGAVLIFAPQRNFIPAVKDEQEQENLFNSTTENQLNELSDYLIDLVVHELRTPLTVILSTSESLKRYRQGWTTEKQDDSLNRIQQATQQITRLLNNVTIWEQLGKEQLTLESDWIDLIALSEEILSNLRLIDEQNHELILSYQGNEKMVYLDRSILEYILNNLLLNGMKYSPANSTVSLNVDYQENYLVLQVADEGIGIPQTEQERIFEPFYRASNTNNIKGTGLGLAIVKEYVQLCGGEISVKNNSQAGTIFTVSLPNK